MVKIPPLIDTHAHLTDSKLAPQIEEVLRRAEDVGIERIVVVGTTWDSSQECCNLCERRPRLVAAVGIQPNHVHEAQPDHWEQIVELAKHASVKAIGETGLDNYWKEAPLPLQRDYFARHLELSQQTGLPFIVHMRDSGAEVLEMLREAAGSGPLRGVMHSFTGDLVLAEECLSLGMYLSFAGMVTFPKSNDLCAVATRVPLDRILVETDSPYLTPEPYRGRRPNEPAMVLHTAQFLARQRDMKYSEFAEQTTRNARDLFRI